MYALLSLTPSRIEVGGEIYYAITDPDTGEFLGGYCPDGESR